MHYERDYGKLAVEESDKDEMALHDMQDWLGEKRWEVLTGEAGESFASKHQIRTVLELVCGVSGYPVEAFIRRYHSHLPESAAKREGDGDGEA